MPDCERGCTQTKQSDSCVSIGVRFVDPTIRIQHQKCILIHEESDIPQMSKTHELKYDGYREYVVVK